METDDYIKIIYKSLKGEATAAEKLRLKKWESSATDNRQLAEQIRLGWQESEPMELPVELDLDADFAKIQSRTRPTAKVVQMESKSARRQWLGWVAAAVALLITGGLWYQNATLATEWVTLTAEQEVEQIELADGTKVWLNQNSELRYPTTFSTKNRPVELTGEAYFAVAKDAQRPFSVQLKNTTVTVLGTEFNIKQAVDFATTEVAVKEGKVRVVANQSEEKVILKANEKTLFEAATNALSPAQIDNNLNQLAWQRQRLQFKNTPLSEVLNAVADYYAILIDLQNENLISCSLSGTYQVKNGATEVLENIAANFNLQIEKLEKNRYQLNGGSCE
ncbi:MAG: FecR family protein [Saprospiraceae bacterium]